MFEECSDVGAVFSIKFNLKFLFELELELIQTHMTQKPMLRVEVGALGAR